MAQTTSAAVHQSVVSCLVCRSRKVKCDEAVPGCQNCQALGIECTGYSTLPEAQKRLGADDLESMYRASGVEKRRVGSCEACKRAKGRCDKVRPACSRCLQKGLVCRYTQKQRGTATTRSNVSEESPENGRPVTDVTDVSPGTAFEPQSSLSPLEPSPRLQNRSLPWDTQMLRTLTSVYFNRVATLRCLDFLHKPSFNHSLDKGSIVEDYGEAILYVMCAHGLRIKELEGSAGPDGQAMHDDVPGRLWAEESQAMVMREISKPTLMTAMTLVLLCDFALQTGQDALAFMLCGCCHSAAQLLALDRPMLPSNNGEKSKDSILAESQRRVLWSCFILDSIVGSGVNENLRWRDGPPQIPLPSSDQTFLSQISSAEAPMFLPRRSDVFPSSEDLQKYNLRSNLIYLMSMRTRVLRLIRINPDAIHISDPESSFLQLLHALEAWGNRVSTQLQLTEFSIYVHKELNTLESLFYLHLSYHILICDLTRISIPGFAFPLAVAFQTAPEPFISHCRDVCRHHATQVTRILQMMSQHLHPLFSESTTYAATYEATKIMIVYSALLGEQEPDTRMRLKEDIIFNMKLLSEQTRGVLPSRACRALTRLLHRFGFNDIANSSRVTPPLLYRRTEDDVGEVSGPPEAFYLSDLAPFRRAYDDVNQNRDRRESAAGSLASSSRNLTQETPVLRPWNPQVAQPLVSSAMASNQVIPLGDWTHVIGDMSNEITWDLFSLPDWVFEQHEMDFGA
ncbi:regulator of drug sensitivity 1 [Fusarium napiforme]|uniref:Regulator of drug sensitivity 1 n=1 Tax=Fusarium napiforme TaxID=42672 RepID=A0A8H5NHH9_9HYPO|nr:regulator of drug sensitivity 1 [Fusarium napiforme]